MQVSIETVTPAMAAEYLKSNTNNRPCSSHRVSDIAGALKRGEWMDNGASICFSVGGVLLDGQGRLKACVSEGVPFTSVVVRDLPSAAFKTIDIGKKRGMEDIFSIAGEKNTSKLARALRFVLMYESGVYSGATYTPQQIERCLQRHAGIRYWMTSATSLYKVTGQSAMVLAVCYLGSLTRPDTAEEFKHKLLSGAGLVKGSPILALRERLQQDRAATTRMSASYIAQLTIWAYNAYARGDERTTLKRTKAGNDLPRIVK